MAIEIQVPGSGPSNSKIVFLGEAPGKDELITKQPFTGASGEILNKLIQSAGHRRSEVYVTNVFKIRLPYDNAQLAYTILGKDIVEEHKQFLYKELEILKPNVICCLGGTALSALYPKSKITTHRGSILNSHLGIKIVPTYHPAALFKKQAKEVFSWKYLHIIQFDICRAFEQSLFPEINYEPTQVRICNNSLQLYQFLRQNDGKDLLSIDIETHKTHPITIALAFESFEAIAIPLINLQGPYETSIAIPKHEQVEIWKLLAKVLANDKVKKVGQNIKFDQTLLENLGFAVNGIISDTMYKMNTLWPELPKKLAFSTSLYTEQPFYKDDGKEYNAKKDKPEVLLRYNGLDAAKTLEIDIETSKEIDGYNLTRFYSQFKFPLYSLYKRIGDRGIKIDITRRAELLKKYTEKLEIVRENLNTLAGEKINFNSNHKGKGGVYELIFYKLGCPFRSGVGEEQLKQLKNNVLKGKGKWERAIKIIDFVLEARKIHKTINTYILAKEDEDGRMRTDITPLLETGRSSTHKLGPPIRTPFIDSNGKLKKKWGIAFQTLTEHGEIGADLKSMYIPDEGKCFIEVDQGGAEARVVFLLAKEYRQLELMDEIDIHSLSAAWINGNEDWQRIYNAYKAGDKQADFERYRAKKGTHAANYDMGAFRFALLADISQWRAGEILKILHGRRPGIRQVFHKSIQDALYNNANVLIGVYGDRRPFLDKAGTEEVFKEAYAYLPQNVVSHKTKITMYEIEACYQWMEILEESHDSFLCQVPLERKEEAGRIIKKIFERPTNFKNCSLPRGELTIPCDVKWGLNWENMKGLKL